MLSRITALLGAVAVGLGAFGAHGLREFLEANDHTEIWNKAVLYHFVHVAVMFTLALLCKGRKVTGPWVCFLLGILLFSGSLYAYALTNVRWLVHVTPIGGTSFLVGWIWLAIRPPIRTGTQPEAL